MVGLTGRSVRFGSQGEKKVPIVRLAAVRTFGKLGIEADGEN